MRSRVEPRRLEFAPRVGDSPRDFGRQIQMVQEHSIDIEHAKSDTFHVEGGDGLGERLAFLDQRLHVPRAVAAELGDNRIDVGLGIEAMVHGWVRRGRDR